MRAHFMHKDPKQEIYLWAIAFLTADSEFTFL